MSYLNLYQKTIIPHMKLPGLYEQKEMFEDQEHPEDKAIYQLICDRIEEIEVLEAIKSAV